MKINIKEILDNKKQPDKRWLASAVEDAADKQEEEKAVSHESELKADEHEDSEDTSNVQDLQGDTACHGVSESNNECLISDIKDEPAESDILTVYPGSDTEDITNENIYDDGIDEMREFAAEEADADLRSESGESFEEAPETASSSESGESLEEAPEAVSSSESGESLEEVPEIALRDGADEKNICVYDEAKSVDEKELLSDKFREHVKAYKWIGGMVAVFAVLLTVTFTYTSLIPREVYATINDKDYKVTTRQYTIEEFLEEKNIEYCKEDYISKPVTTYIYDGISFKLEHATSFKVTADGETKEYKTLERTVGNALKDCGIEVGDADIVNPAAEESIGDDMDIVVQRVTTGQETVEEKIPFETKEKDDSSLNEGTSKVVTEGTEGIDKVTYEITYIDGKESSRKEISRTSVTAPVDKVIANGTKINFNGKSYSRKLVVKAYAYTGGGRTAMGTKARVGEIAVDPSVIPLGTNVYIEGVGARRAEDTGGNIKGNTIDIYMNSQSQCIKWGARYVTIYIE